MADVITVIGKAAATDMSGGFFRGAGDISSYFIADSLSANGLLSAFASGVVMSTKSRNTRDAVERFCGTSGQLLNGAVFFAVGAIILPEYLHAIGWRHVVFAALALTVLRMGPVYLCMTGMALDARTRLFIGWFTRPDNGARQQK